MNHTIISFFKNLWILGTEVNYVVTDSPYYRNESEERYMSFFTPKDTEEPIEHILFK